jgi:protein-S-isoprenylcysteine O-methyltransferase Ste14
MDHRISSAVGAVVWLVLALAFAERALGETTGAGRLPAGGLALENGLLALLFLLRREADRTCGAGQFLLALAVTASPLLFRPAEIGWELCGLVLQMLSILWLLASLLALGTSIGVAPADRGLRTGGPYRLVRHPLYAGGLICAMGYVISNISLQNTVLWLAILAGQLLRIRWEEKLLSEPHEAYGRYRRQVRWRLLPFVY